MAAHKPLIPILIFLLVLAAGCTAAGVRDSAIPSPHGLAVKPLASMTPSAAAANPAASASPVANSPFFTRESQIPIPTETATSTVAAAPTQTEVVFAVGEELTIEYLRQLEITGSQITFEGQLADRSNYSQHLVSYISEGNKINGLLTIPLGEPPAGGFKAIVFNHGYIPPAEYQTTERYNAYVDYLARNGFVVFKIDYRGHGQSQGQPSGTYFSPGYTIDAISALKSLQMLDIVDPLGIGLWGHSMAGNLVLRAMLVEPDIKAGVIWAGAVYSYDDFVHYGITDNTYRPPATPQTEETPSPRRRTREIFDIYGQPDSQSAFWKAVSLTENIQFLNSPLQLHHAQDDNVVSIAYSTDLAAVLEENGKQYEFYSYEGGGHNLVSPYFEQAMQRTVQFFRDNL